MYNLLQAKKYNVLFLPSEEISMISSNPVSLEEGFTSALLSPCKMKRFFNNKVINKTEIGPFICQ